MKRLYALILLLFSLILPFDGQDGSLLCAQGNDPVLAGMIFQYTDKAKKELKQQEQMMHTCIYRPYMDQGRGGRYYQPTEGVQQLS